MTGLQPGRAAPGAARAAVLHRVRERGLQRLDEPVQLASGAWSSEFVDAKRALAAGEDLALACQALLDVATELGAVFEAVGGLTLGADQFAHGMAIVGGKSWFVIRKAAKGRGTNQRVEGADIAGVRVLLVDDVVTTGGSILEALEVARELGAEVAGAVTLLDRGDNAEAAFARREVPYQSLLTYRDLDIEPVAAP